MDDQELDRLLHRAFDDLPVPAPDGRTVEQALARARRRDAAPPARRWLTTALAAFLAGWAAPRVLLLLPTLAPGLAPGPTGLAIGVVVTTLCAPLLLLPLMEAPGEPS